MNKSQLVQSLAKDVRISKSLAEKSINAIFSTIKTGLKKDKAVQLIGFGTFRVVNRKARDGRNPQTGEAMRIRASRTVGFRPGKGLKKSI